MPNRLIEAFAHFGKVPGDHTDTVVELLTQGCDLFCLAGNRLLLPAVGDGFEECDEGGGGGDNHLIIDSLLNQLRVLLQRRAENRFIRQEEYHKLRCILKLLAIRLTR